MHTLLNSIEQTQAITDRLGAGDLTPTEPTLQYMWVQVWQFKPVEHEEWSIQVNPFHGLPVRILHKFDSPNMMSRRFIELYPSLIPKFLTNLLLASDHILPTVAWDPRYSEVDTTGDWRILKTRMGKIEFIPIPGDPREVIEIYIRKRGSLLIARSAIPTLAFGLCCALRLLQRMHPAACQLELIYGCMADEPSSCLPVKEDW